MRGPTARTSTDHRNSYLAGINRSRPGNSRNGEGEFDRFRLDEKRKPSAVDTNGLVAPLRRARRRLA